VEATREIHPFHDFQQDAAGFREFLSLMARISTIEISDEYVSVLPKFDLAKRLVDAPSTLGRIWEHGVSGSLGPALGDLCMASKAKVSALCKLSRELASRVREMPEGLCHNDLYPDHAGRRVETGEMIMLDLESMALAPRFTDVGLWLGAPDEVSYLPDRSALVDYFLDEYQRRGKGIVDKAEFMEEARAIWQSRTLGMLNFALHRALDGRVDWTSDRDEGRAVYRNDLLRSLEGLFSTFF